MARKHANTDEEAEINITPMLDVVFIMLIFFIVTTSFIKETGIDPQRPPAVTAQKKVRGNIFIAISATSQIWMEKRQVELHQVRAMTARARAENPESSVIIISDEKADTGTLLDLMDQVNAAGIQNVSIAAEASGG